MARVVIPGFRKIETSSGGEGGTSNYNDLTNKPSINNVPLVGNLNTVNLKLTDATLTEEGVPAEAKTVGDKLEEHSTSLTALKEQLGNHTVKSDVPENAVFTDTVYDDTEVRKRISDNGYGEVAGGKNLVKSYQSSETADKYYVALQADVKLKPSTTYTISFIGTKNNLIYGNEDIFNNPALDISCTGERQSITMTTLSTLSDLDSQFKIIFKNSQGNTIIPNFTDVQIEEGSVATEYEPYFPSNKMLEEEKADKSEITVNLLKPTLGTITQNGVTCTNNGDGTYTFTGTNSSSTKLNFLTGNVTITNKDRYKLVGCPTNKSTGNHIHIYLHNDDYSIVLNDFGNGNDKVNNTILPSGVYYIMIEVIENETVNDIFKPMITTNLDATYDDFVPYTGDSGSLNVDVASLLKRIETLESLVNKTDTTTTE